MWRRAPIVVLSVLFAGCMVGPNYKRPGVAAPPQFRGAQTDPSHASLGDVKWFDLFQDPILRGLIEQALHANYDIGIAAQRVVEGQGQVAVTRSSLFPTLDAQSSASRVGVITPVQSIGTIYGLSSWEPDFWGKFRRATQAARAELLASQDNQEAVMQSLIAQVATAYFDLCEYDAELVIVRDSIKTRRASVELVAARVDGGVASELDLDQAKSLVESAQSYAILLEKAQAQTEDLINFLLAKLPGPVTRGKTLLEQNSPPEVPAGLPSALLDRRPDVRAAEQQLVAANARVGVAKAAFFPTITLTAAGGVGSTDLLGSVQRSGPAYSLLGLLDMPIFQGGRLSGNYKIAKAEKQELLLNYFNSVNGAFRDVSDALIGHQKSKEYVASQTVLTDTLRHQSMMATERYAGGVSSYLEVLDTERQRLTAEQQLTQAQRDVLTALVQVYKSLGGGWQ
jgi:outer membrane protein, multidrug efflux system